MGIFGNIMLKKVRILAIDDEIKALELFKLTLEASDFDVLIAANGEDGLNIALQQEPDLVLLDIRMPKLDGWEVCKRLKAISATQNIPVVFLTAFSSQKDRDRAMNLGVRAYLTKPIDPDSLVAVIHDILANLL
jgi:DNA-binding response OmpR family regulator